MSLRLLGNAADDCFTRSMAGIESREEREQAVIARDMAEYFDEGDDRGAVLMFGEERWVVRRHVGQLGV